MKDKINEDLRRWFKEKWVDISKKDASGNHPPCGRSKSKKKGYPKCRPSKRVSSDTPETSGEMSQEEKKKAVSQKRSAEKKKRKGKKPHMTSHKSLGEYFQNFTEFTVINEGKNKPTNPKLWSKAKSKAKSKFKVYPSAYANAWAAKWYKKHGGGWKSVNENFAKTMLGAGALGVALGLSGAAYRKSQIQQQEPQQAAEVAPQAEPKKPKVVAKPKEPEKPVEAPDPFDGNEHVKRLYGAIVSGEHRGRVDDPYAYDPRHYIRTFAPEKGKKSTAWGPVQITVSTARGYLNSKDPHHAAFLEQGRNFSAASNDDPTFGYGKAGTLGGEEHHHNNIKVAIAVMRGKAKEAGVDITKPLDQKQLNRFLTHWRFGLNNKEKLNVQQHDPGYWKHATSEYYQ